MCCMESGEREAAVSLFCPKAKPGERKFRKVNIYYIKLNLIVSMFLVNYLNYAKVSRPIVCIFQLLP